MESYGTENGTQKSGKIADIKHLEREFLDSLESKGRSDNTIKNYRTDLECFNQYMLRSESSNHINMLGQDDMRDYGDYLCQRYKSDNSRRRRVQSLRIFFDYLVEENLYTENPVRAIPTSPKFLDIPRPTPFFDIKTLWQHILEESHSKEQMSRLTAKRNAVILFLIYGAGLKVSTLSTLKVEHINCPPMGRSPSVMVIPRKRDPYTVPLPEAFTPLYHDYKTEIDAAKKAANITFDQVLFNANPYRILSGGLSPRGIELVFEDLRNKLTITLTPKSLRQACIFKWLQQGVADETIKEWLGVAPSYQLSLYKNVIQNNFYDDKFLGDMYLYYSSRNYSS